jgi:dolichyl-phosphate beta-glucosyltransferase
MSETERKPPLLSIVIPAYNEADNLRSDRLERLEKYLTNEPYESEVIVVDDGSADATADLLTEFCSAHPRFSLLRKSHRGKAHAVASGVLAARGEYVLFMDMDLATSLEHIREVLTTLQNGEADVAIASREIRGSRRLDAPLPRRLLGKAFNLLVQALLLPGLWDTQCGFKAFRREVARELFNGLVVFASSEDIVGPRVTAFDVELLVAARRRGYRIKEQPVTWRHTKTTGVDILREPFRMLRELLWIWLTDRRGRYRPTAK